MRFKELEKCDLKACTISNTIWEKAANDTNICNESVERGLHSHKEWLTHKWEKKAEVQSQQKAK